VSGRTNERINRSFEELFNCARGILVCAGVCGLSIENGGTLLYDGYGVRRKYGPVPFFAPFSSSIKGFAPFLPLFHRSVLKEK
jgi:hypothetical protein